MRLMTWMVLLLACRTEQEAGPVSFERSAIEVGGSPYALVAADVTGDGADDLVVADQPGARLIVLAGDGEGGFRVAGEVPSGENPGGLAAADLDEDGRTDLVVANHETDHLTLLRGIGGGAFEPFQGSPLGLEVSPHVHLVAAADVDGDGHVDLVVDHRAAGGLRLFAGRGDGTFGSGRTVETGGDPYRGMAIVDLDGDGRPDAATANFGDGTVTVLLTR